MSSNDHLSKERYHSVIETFRSAIFDTIPDPLIVLNPDLTILTANESFYRHFKVNPDDIKNRCIYDIGNKQWDIPLLRELLEKILPEKTIIKDFEVTHNFPILGNRTMLVNAREIKSSQFLPLDLILVTLTDITDRKKWTDSLIELNNKIKASNNELERYGHTLSHDLRAPLNVIISFSEIILSDYAPELPNDVKEYIGRITYNAQVMNQMISALSQLAGLTRYEIYRIPISLSDIANKIISQLKNNEPERIVDITIQSDMIANADPSMMLIALTNLLRNSWKFTRERSTTKIIFGQKSGNDHIIYFIKDNGIGFNMKYAYKLFKMFQKLHSDTIYEGTGTGLAIVKAVIEKHGGEIWIDSKEGEGTTVYFTL